MAFSNPIVGGTALVRPAIKSPNYVPGSVGWSINRDGTAEFSGATIRGDLIVGTPPTFIEITNTIPTIVGLYYTGLGLTVNEIMIVQQSVNNYWYEANVTGGLISGVVRGVVNGTTTADVHELTREFFTAGVLSWGIGAQNNVRVEVGDSGGATQVEYRIRQNSLINVFSGGELNMAAGSIWQVDGLSYGRGLLAQVADTASSGTVTAEAVVLTLPSITINDGRAVCFKFGGQLVSSANNVSTFRIRRTNAGGTLVLGGMQYDGVNGSNREREGQGIAVNTSGSAVSVAYVLTLQASTGNSTHVGGANLPRWFEAWDCGAAADFTNRPSV